jgi:lysophospholipase L1-like esterase
MTSARSRVRVVALGDSLTVGFRSGVGLFCEQEPTPYTDTLTDRIRRDFADGAFSVEVVNKGVNGDLTEQMLSRFDSDVLHLSPKIVIVLGGSNDLGWGLAPTEVFSNLLQMYTLSLKSAITPIACTVPSVLGFDAGIPPRLELNELIRRHCQRMQLRIVDLFSVTMHQDTRCLDPRYSSDGLHLSAEGYEKMGEAVYEEALHSLLYEIAEKNPR